MANQNSRVQHDHGVTTTGKDGTSTTVEKQHNEDECDPFPWDIGVYDSHCHPTESMDTISELENMKARVLTIMSTRFQDQHLVAKLAKQYEYNSADLSTQIKVVPSFGYHPWLSYLISDDLNNPSEETPTKTIHYNNVLTSTPVEDDLREGLPDPVPLSKILQETRANLLEHPNALLGEVGLDRMFRIPHSETSRNENSTVENRTPGTHHDHRLTKHRVSPAHQIRIMQAQLRLAGELNRAASVHVVGGQGAAYEAMRELWRGFEVEVQSARERKMMWRKKGDPVVIEEEPLNEANTDTKPFPPRICLHSFSGPPETIQQYLHPSIPVEFYFSFSEAINFSLPDHQKRSATDGKPEPSWQRALEALKAVPEDRLLIESDLGRCGHRMDTLLEGIIRRVCSARGWSLMEGTEKLKRNWHGFVFGQRDNIP